MKFLLFASAACVFAQSTDPRVQRFASEYIRQHPLFDGAAQPAAVRGMIPKRESSNPCAVPLIQASIPKDKQFAMAFAASSHVLGKMPQAIAPAPSCAHEIPSLR